MMAMNVLVAVVDDDESVRKALGRLICSAGYDVQSFASGTDFLHSTQQRPECVVLDIRMPHLDGFEVQQEMMKAELRIPLIIISGDDCAEYHERALRHGAMAYLRKPIDDAMLLDAIRCAVQARPGTTST
jgi:FixJ family two-component response regulator